MVGLGLVVAGLSLTTLKKTSLIEPSVSRKIFNICLWYFCSSHSLANEFGVATTASPFSIETMLVDLNQVVNIAGETFNCI